MKWTWTLLLIGGVSLGGCGTTGTPAGGLSREMASLQGASADDAVATWGQPDERHVVGDELFLVWQDFADSRSPTGTFAAAGGPVLICERVVAVSDAGTITGWRWRGDACEHVHTRRNGAFVAAR